MELTYYELLNVGQDATDKEIEKAYHRRSKIFHPDVGDEFSSESMQRALNAAKETLLDATKRSDYDYQLAHSHTQDLGPSAYRPAPEPHVEEPVYERPERPSANYDAYRKLPTRAAREAPTQHTPRESRLLILAVVLWFTAPLFGGLDIGALDVRSVLAFFGGVTFIAFLAFSKSKVARVQAAFAAWRHPSELRDLTKDKTPTAP